MRWAVTAGGKRTHDVCSPICKAEVITMNISEPFRDVLLPHTTENTTVRYRLAPQHHCNDSNLAPENTSKDFITTQQDACTFKIYILF